MRTILADWSGKSIRQTTAQVGHTRLFLREDDYREAVVTANQALALEVDAHWTHILLVRILIQLNRFEDAEQVRHLTVRFLSGKVRYL